MSRAHSYSHSRAHSPNFSSFHLRHKFSNPSVALPTSQLILQPFRCFTYVTVNSPTLLSLLLHHKFFTQFTWRAIRAHSLTFPSLHLRHNSFSNPSVVWPTSQLILQAFRRFTYTTAPSPTLPLLHLRHISFSNPPFVSPTSQALQLIHLESHPWINKARKGPNFHHLPYIWQRSPSDILSNLGHSAIYAFVMKCSTTVVFVHFCLVTHQTLFRTSFDIFMEQCCVFCNPQYCLMLCMSAQEVTVF